jgi:branched-chain amino acid transport system substrate-binding protein
LMEAKIMANFIANNPDFKGKKVGIIMQADDFGNDAKKGFDQEKFKFDATVRYPNGQQGDAKQVDLWIQKLKDAGIGNGDVVIIFGVTTATAAALNAAFNAKFAPQWILGSVGADSTTLSGINRVLLALLNNAIGLSFLPSPTDTSDEYIKLFTEINEKYNNKAVMDFNVIAGMNTAMVMTQALHAAGPNPTRTGLMNALETKGKDFFSAGLTSLGYSTTARVGYNGYYIGRYNARGELKPLNDKVVIYSTDSGTGPVVTSDKIARKPMPDKGLPK